jgi:hypothetical protein
MRRDTITVLNWMCCEGLLEKLMRTEGVGERMESDGWQQGFNSVPHN